MRRMKGDEEPEMAIGTLLFVGGILVIFAIIFARYTQYDAIVKTNSESIEMVNFAHYSKECFSTDGYLRDDLMTKQHKAECNLHVYVCIKDLETGDMWLDCSETDHPGHTIHAPLVRGDEIHMGEISVQE